VTRCRFTATRIVLIVEEGRLPMIQGMPAAHRAVQFVLELLKKLGSVHGT